MSKQTELAAFYIGIGMGYDDCAQDITEPLDIQETIDYYNTALQYAPVAAAMVEAAHGITFQYPREWQWEIYRYFGETLNDHSEFIEANENLDEDDDDYDEDASDQLEPADRKPMLDLLENLVINEFYKVAPAQQHQKIRDAVAQARAETA
jgi:hypothetical protein